jgi:hypothetical protein
MRQYGLFRYLNNVLPCGLGHGQVLEKSGERGRNRTYNLLIKSHAGLSIHLLETAIRKLLLAVNRTSEQALDTLTTSQKLREIGCWSRPIGCARIPNSNRVERR